MGGKENKYEMIKEPKTRQFPADAKDKFWLINEFAI